MDSSQIPLTIKDVNHKITRKNIEKYNIDITQFTNLESLRKHIRSIRQKIYVSNPEKKEKKNTYHTNYVKERCKDDEEYKIKRNQLISQYKKKKRAELNGGTPRPKGRPPKCQINQTLVQV
jgi:hypothetical protein